MRTTLVDWLGEVRDEFCLHSETLFLAVAYLDRYLAAKPISRGRFQLLGLACVWVAAKFEEVYSPPLAAMLAMAENMYSADDLRVMEKEVLFTLDFGLALPTSLRFLHYLVQLAPLPAHPAAATATRRLAEALLELTLLDGCVLLGALPSHVAAAAVYLAMGLLAGEAEGLRGVLALSKADPDALGTLVQRLSQVLNDAIAQPQPCALLIRFRAWRGLYGADCSPAGAPVIATACYSASESATAPAAAVPPTSSSSRPSFDTVAAASASVGYPAAPQRHLLHSLQSDQHQQQQQQQQHHCSHREWPAASAGLSAAAAAINPPAPQQPLEQLHQQQQQVWLLAQPDGMLGAPLAHRPSAAAAAAVAAAAAADRCGSSAELCALESLTIATLPANPTASATAVTAC